MGGKKLFEYIISFPKSLFFCIRTLPFRQAICLPVFVRYNTIIKNYGKISISQKDGSVFARIKIGFGNVGIFDKKNQRTIWDVNGKVSFSGNAFIGHGSRIVVSKQGILALGSDFTSTAMMSIICGNSIKMGNSVLVSWETLIMDTDFHSIIVEGKIKESIGNIIIGDHVWIGCRVTILKNTIISTNSIIASGSVISGYHTSSNCLLAGVPAREKTYNINWTV